MFPKFFSSTSKLIYHFSGIPPIFFQNRPELSQNYKNLVEISPKFLARLCMFRIRFMNLEIKFVTNMT